MHEVRKYEAGATPASNVLEVKARIKATVEEAQAREDERNIERLGEIPVRYAMHTEDQREQLRERKLLRGDDALLDELQSRYLSMSPPRRKRFANELSRIMESKAWQETFALDTTLEAWQKKHPGSVDSSYLALGRVMWRKLKAGEQLFDAAQAGYDAAIKVCRGKERVEELAALRKKLPALQVPAAKRLMLGGVQQNKPKKGKHAITATADE